jgi:hypothetical protein
MEYWNKIVYEKAKAEAKGQKFPVFSCQFSVPKKCIRPRQIASFSRILEISAN